MILLAKSRNDMIFPLIILQQQNIIALAISFVKRISFPLGNIIATKKKSLLDFSFLLPGADDENLTHKLSLGSSHFTTKLHPHKGKL